MAKKNNAKKIIIVPVAGTDPRVALTVTSAREPSQAVDENLKKIKKITKRLAKKVKNRLKN